MINLQIGTNSSEMGKIFFGFLPGVKENAPWAKMQWGKKE